MTSVVTLQRETFRTGQSWAIGDVLHQTENRMRSAHAPHLGYPYNLVGYSPVPCNKGEAHAIVMPNVTDTLISRFVSDYLAWWKTSQRQGALR